MCLISTLYLKKFVCRYDRPVAIPYYSPSDFKGLIQESYSFINSENNEIRYFYYYYPKHSEDKIILFCHGIGPGHIAYLKEIDVLAKKGYRVLTLDYQGCGYSKGNYLGSLNSPTRDVIELIDFLKLDKKIILFGHSLGGYTALNVLKKKPHIKTAVVMSAFLSIKDLCSQSIKSKFITSRILNFEKKKLPDYYGVDLLDFLKNTEKNVYFIQSRDDMIVKPSISIDLIKRLKNSHIIVKEVDHKNHNPNYTFEAVKYMQQVFNEYYRLIKEKKIKTDEEKIKFFANVSLHKMTEQDEKIFEGIDDFINENI